jgi:hypothetical protein
VTWVFGVCIPTVRTIWRFFWKRLPTVRTNFWGWPRKGARGSKIGGGEGGSADQGGWPFISGFGAGGAGPRRRPRGTSCANTNTFIELPFTVLKPIMQVQKVITDTCQGPTGPKGLFCREGTQGSHRGEGRNQRRRGRTCNREIREIRGKLTGI